MIIKTYSKSFEIKDFDGLRDNDIPANIVIREDTYLLKIMLQILGNLKI